MKKAASSASAGGTSGGFGEHIEAFLKTLGILRYVETTRRQKRRCLERFVRWVRERRLAPDVLDEACARTYLERVRRRPYRRGSLERATLHQFLDHLRSAGVVPPREGAGSSTADVLTSRYVEHLRRGRGLSERSVTVYSPFVREFVAELARIGGSSLAAPLDAALVRRHLLDRARGRSAPYTRLLAAALRSFLRFLFLEGEASTDLSRAVPPVRRWQRAAVPAFLSADEVERVLAGIDRTTTRGRRALAMLLLMARLGLRPGEVSTLDLDDVLWSAGEIVVPGKGRSRDRLPLPDDVGRALALYLRHDRGPSASRRLFLRMRAPRVGLTGPHAVCAVARQAIRRAGLRPHGRVGGHLFRHSLARRLLRHGASLGEIAQVLRHRSLQSTQVYARIDFEALGEVARPWPLAAGGGR